MIATIRQYLAGIAAQKDARALRSVIDPIGDRMSTQPLKTAGLVIKAGGSALAKIGATDFYGTVKGRLVTIAASTDMPALVGSITAAKYNVFCFYVDIDSAVTVAMGTEGATIGAVKFPAPPSGKMLLGFILVTYASTFVGGTTPLDTATTVYFSTLGPFDPTILVS